MNSLKGFLGINMLLVVIVLSFSLLNASASDELMLRGIIKDVNYKNKIATVNVMSDSCRGMRNFKVNDPYKLDGKMGKEVRFQIDKSTCKGKVIPQIIYLNGNKL